MCWLGWGDRVAVELAVRVIGEAVAKGARVTWGRVATVVVVVFVVFG